MAIGTVVEILAATYAVVNVHVIVIFSPPRGIWRGVGEIWEVEAVLPQGVPNESG